MNKNLYAYLDLQLRYYILSSLMPLIVKPISANITSDKDFFGKADPYCKIKVGNEEKRTRTINGGGKNPQWTDTFQFDNQGPILTVEVWDDDTFSDDLIGAGSVNLNQCYMNPNRTENQYVDLIHHGKSAGRLLLSLEYQGAPMGGQMGGWNGGQQQGGWGGQQQGGWGGPQQGGWNGGQQQGGWGGQQQGGWGGQQQGGWGGQQAPQPGWGGQQQGGWNGGQQQGGWGGQQQGGWGGQGGRGW